MKGKIYKYTKTGNKYEVLESEAELKDRTTRKWVECIIYQSLDTHKIYVRSKTEFKKKFELCEE